MSKTTFSFTLDKVNPHDLSRHTWEFNPTTRVVGSKKQYNRQKSKAEARAMLKGM